MIKKLWAWIKSPKRHRPQRLLKWQIIAVEDDVEMPQYKVAKADRPDTYIDIYNDPYPPYFK